MPHDRELPALASLQRAGFQLKIGERASIGADVAITTAGILSIAALVGSSLLGSAVIVWAARRPRPPRDRAPAPADTARIGR